MSAALHPLPEPAWRAEVRPRALAGAVRFRHLPAYAAMALAVCIRAAHVLSAPFPLNDGGLFYRMTEEVQAAHFRLPAFSTYNDAHIPFAYSPLGFYLAAALHALTGAPLLQLFRFLPLLVTCLTVVAFYQFARAVLRTEWRVVAAVCAFAIIPRSYNWLIMGGGLTRSLGLLFALVALRQVYALYTRREWRYAATATAACALTVLSHLSTANFLAISIVLLFAVYGRHRHGVVSSAVVAAGTVLLTAPWWGTVIAQHGVAPFLAAQSVNGSFAGDRLVRYEVLLRLARLNTDIGGEPFFPLVSAMAVLGCAACLRPDRLVFPVWWVLIVVSDPRGGNTYAPIVTALLAGFGVVDVLLPGLLRLYLGAHPTERRGADKIDVLHAIAPQPWLRWAPAVLLGGMLTYSATSSLTHSQDYGGETWVLRALSAGDRDAMRWAAASTAPSSRFVVVSGTTWAIDRVAEWFPVLANRPSVGTIQGTEWLPGFRQRLKQNDQGIQATCPKADGSCVEQWAAATGRTYTHIYVVKTPAVPCCARLIANLQHDSRYTVVYDGPAALIAARR